jgi:hypothetical protein
MIMIIMMMMILIVDDDDINDVGDDDDSNDVKCVSTTCGWWRGLGLEGGGVGRDMGRLAGPGVGGTSHS